MTDLLPMIKAVLSTSALRWLQLTKRLPDDLLKRKPAAGEWSATDCLIHIVDTEHIFPARVEAILAGRDIPNFDPDSEGTKYTDPVPMQLAEEFARLRQVGLVVLERVTEQDFDRTAIHSELGMVTMRQLLHEWAAHDLNHIIQAERAIMQPLIIGSGPWRAYFQDHEYRAP